MSPPSATPKQLDVLLVDDNEDDIELARQAFKRAGHAGELHVATDGLDGLKFLRREPPYENAPRPAIAIADLNMPRMDGRELLHNIKNDPRLQRLPVIILTTSEAETDVLRAYELHANAYMVKPLDFDRFVEIARAVKRHWLEMATLP
jgi:chemotaxis family two-component system response regulator Rcp1